MFSPEFTSRLTNEESRKNWEEHGNPDGPGGRALTVPSLYFDSIKLPKSDCIELNSLSWTYLTPSCLTYFGWWWWWW